MVLCRTIIFCVKTRSHCNGNGNDKVFSNISLCRCRHSMNTITCCHDTHFFRCHCHHNWVQNPFNDDTQWRKNLINFVRCRRSVNESLYFLPKRRRKFQYLHFFLLHFFTSTYRLVISPENCVLISESGCHHCDIWSAGFCERSGKFIFSAHDSTKKIKWFKIVNYIWKACVQT